MPPGPNHTWSTGFDFGALANGKPIQCLTAVDDCTKESVEIAVARRVNGQCVTDLLDAACRFRGYPSTIRTDQGPEFTGRALDQWAHANGVKLMLIQPGKPTRNAYIESFNGRFRDECLNEHWFVTLDQAKAQIAEWCRDYNGMRPHSSLPGRTSAEFAANMRADGTIATKPASDKLATRALRRSRWPWEWEQVNVIDDAAVEVAGSMRRSEGAAQTRCGIMRVFATPPPMGGERFD